mmetsp:Transcript_107556/g.272985  ORF Transcript_107556/g.272985 Transcript_107556/m.272985 type:complete len:253 (+) Transcript_107556:43-801(+)
MPRSSRFGQWASTCNPDVNLEAGPPQALPAASQHLSRPSPGAPEEGPACPDDPSVLLGAPPHRDGSAEVVAGPLWFRVMFAPNVRVRREPDANASPVTFLERGEIVEASEVRSGWANLAQTERESRDISKDCGAWVLIDGRSLNLGILLEPYMPRWFKVVFEPRVAVRKAARSDAPAICWLDAGEVVEVAAVRSGWVALSAFERRARDISRDCGSWLLIDASDRGLGRLLQICPPPGLVAATAPGDKVPLDS